jgi:hypothetical protein
MRKLTGLRELTRRMNLGIRCERCYKPIERLSDHVNRHGRPICLRLNDYEKQLTDYPEWTCGQSDGHSTE